MQKDTYTAKMLQMLQKKDQLLKWRYVKTNPTMLRSLEKVQKAL